MERNIRKIQKMGTRNALFIGDCGLRINDFIVSLFNSCAEFVIIVFFTALLKSLLPELCKISLFSSHSVFPELIRKFSSSTF